MSRSDLSSVGTVSSWTGPDFGAPFEAPVRPFSSTSRISRATERPRRLAAPRRCDELRTPARQPGEPPDREHERDRSPDGEVVHPGRVDVAGRPAWVDRRVT